MSRRKTGACIIWKIREQRRTRIDSPQIDTDRSTKKRSRERFIAMGSGEPTNRIGSLNEKPLHAALKQWCATPGSETEVPVGSYFIDVIRDEVLVEIQTKSFGSIKRKLLELTASRKVILVHPIAQEKWIVRLTTNKDGAEIRRRRRSPKKGRVEDVFRELVAIPGLLTNPNFALQVVLIREEEIRIQDAKRGWRRKGWVIQERHLLEVVDHRLFESPEDMARLLPVGLPEEFTTSDLADATRTPRWLAQKMAYCLREMGAIESIGKRMRAVLYRRAEAA